MRQKIAALGCASRAMTKNGSMNLAMAIND